MQAEPETSQLYTYKHTERSTDLEFLLCAGTLRLRISGDAPMHEHELTKNALVKGQVLMVCTSCHCVGDRKDTGVW
jgi:hypothetical protein